MYESTVVRRTMSQAKQDTFIEERSNTVQDIMLRRRREVTVSHIILVLSSIQNTKPKSSKSYPVKESVRALVM